ncbi:hypothetical protein [Mycolicibacterium sp.]|uniref:hypothetical protein n=1 Tax=Mycolicibacterium sp. TaxID=2320850 RepID=UPI0037C99AFE
MRSYDVSLDDHMVFDCEGSVWVAGGDDRWYYLAEDGLSDWDSRAELPAEYAPYTRLAANVQSLISHALGAAGAMRK